MPRWVQSRHDDGLSVGNGIQASLEKEEKASEGVKPYCCGRPLTSLTEYEKNIVLTKQRMREVEKKKHHLRTTLHKVWVADDAHNGH